MKFGMFRGRPLKKNDIVQEFDRSVIIDIYLCGISMGAALAVGAVENSTMERANEVSDAVVAGFTGDPLMMETVRLHVLEHLKGAVSHDVPGVRR